MTSPTVKPRSYTISEGEKITPVMLYTLNTFAWGEVVTKEAIRVSTWLRTPSAPQYITMREAHVLMLGGSTPVKPQTFPELQVPASQVVAFHMLPPARDPLDYEPNEPHRKMEPTTALVGSFRLDGFIRMSTQTTLERYLDVTKEAFTALYDVEITQPVMPALGIIRTPYVLLRRDLVLFSRRENGSAHSLN